MGVLLLVLVACAGRAPDTSDTGPADTADTFDSSDTDTDTDVDTDTDTDDTDTDVPTDDDHDGATRPSDCLDDDPTVHPGATEVCRNGKDDDCDGTAGPCAWSGLVPWDAGSASAGATASIAVGDLDGDGRDDVVRYDDAVVVIPGDVDGDGRDDLAVGTYGVVIAGAATWSSETEDDGVGSVLASAGDVDGDGLADLVVGAPSGDVHRTDGGAVYVLRRATEGGGSLAKASTRVYGASTGYSSVGRSAAGVGDVDGDGLDDVAYGGLRAGEGAVWLLPGPSTGASFPDAAPAVVTTRGSPALAASPGTISGGDLDGDGYADLVLGAPDVSEVFVLPGPLAGEVDAGEGATLYASATDRLGETVLVPGDVDGDGLADAVVTAPGARDGDGSAWLVPGPISGVRTVDDRAAAELVGPTGGGLSVVAAGDTVGDGMIDLVLGAPVAGVWALMPDDGG